MGVEPETPARQVKCYSYSSQHWPTLTARPGAQGSSQLSTSSLTRWNRLARLPFPPAEANRQCKDQNI